MNIGTRSILFGVHCFFIHPFFVALGWWRLYGFPFDPRLWVAFFVHDLGYWGKPNMDGPEGEKHPELGARIVHSVCDYGNNYLPFSEDNTDLWAQTLSAYDSTYWYRFTRYHSRYLSKTDNVKYSPLCCADKLATAYVPTWLYLVFANLSGEVHEYMHGKGARTAAKERGQWRWAKDMQTYCETWALHHANGDSDEWTGTARDNAREVSC